MAYGNETGSTSHTHDELTDLDRMLNTAVLCIVIVVTVLGNSVALAAFAISPSLRQRVTNYFIVLLCVSDITIALVVMPLWVSYVKTGYPDYVRDAAVYDFYLVTDMLCSTSSIVSLAAISVERYLSISHPMRYDRVMTHQTTCVALGVIVVYSLATAMLGLVQRKGGDPRLVPVVIFTLAYAIPIAIKVVCYGQIFKTARVQLGKIQQMRQLRHPAVVAYDCTDQPGTADATQQHKHQQQCAEGTGHPGESEQLLRNVATQQQQQGPAVDNAVTARDDNKERRDSESKQRGKFADRGRLRRTRSSFTDIKQRSMTKMRRFRREFRAAKVLGLIIGTFVVLWTPFMVVVLISSQWNRLVSLRAIVITKDLHYMNSAINPILYVLLNREYRRGVRRVIKRAAAFGKCNVK